MGFQTIGTALHQSLAHRRPELTGQLLTARVVYLAGRMIENLWPQEQAAYVRVVSFHEGKLVFEATIGAAVQALKMQHVAVQNAINRELGQKIVQTIEVRQGASNGA